MKKSFTLIIVALIISDQLTGLLFNVGADFFRIGLVVKIVIEFAVLSYYLTQIHKATIFSMYLAVVLLFMLWTMGATTSFFRNPEFDLGYSFLVLNRYLFLFILSCVFFSLKDDDLFHEKCSRLIEGFFIVNNLLIFFGLVFKVDLLSTYNPLGLIPDPRFGYKGLISGGNDVAGVYIVGVAYFFRKRFLEKERNDILLLATSMAAICTGTRAALLGVLTISGYYFIKYNRNFLLKYGLLAFVILTICVVIKWNTIYANFLLPSQQRINDIGLITYLMSNRDQAVIRNFDYIFSSWNIINHLTGDAFLYSETDLLDLYFFFGILGTMLYLYLYARIFFVKDRSIDNFYFFLVLMGLAFTAGHIILSAVVPIFILLFVFSKKLNRG